jgi:hypothetical protein
MIQTSRSPFEPEDEQAVPTSSGSRWTASLWGLIWRGLAVLLVPVVLPSQAQISAAHGDSQRLMVAVVAGLAAAAVLGLPLGLWKRGGVLGSGYRVVAAAVAVRLAFPGPIALMMTTWMVALAVAVADGLYAAGARFAARRTAAPPQFVSEPAFLSTPPPPPIGAYRADAPRAELRPGRPVLPWFVALVGLLGVAAFAWASNTDVLPRSGPSLVPPATSQQPQAPPATSQPQAPAVTSQPQGPPVTTQPQAPPDAAPAPQPAPAPGQSVCGQVGGASVCVEAPPITNSVVGGES